MGLFEPLRCNMAREDPGGMRKWAIREMWVKTDLFKKNSEKTMKKAFPPDDRARTDRAACSKQACRQGSQLLV